MNIYEKIEEIRNKPEHIRMRYVWILMIVSMVIIITIWIISFWGAKSRQAIENDPMEVFNDLKSQTQTLDQYKDQADELKDNFNQLKNDIESGALNEMTPEDPLQTLPQDSSILENQ